MQQLLRISIEACLKAGEATLAYYGKPVHVDIKSDNSPLTKADLASNTVINKYLIETEIPILSEENTQAGYAERKHWQKLWVVDPLDGTKEFIKKRKEYTINIALIENGNPLLGVIYAPILDELFFGLAGIASYKLTNASKNKYLLNDPMEVAEKITGHTSPTDLIVVASKSHLSPETEKFIKRIEEKASGLRVKSYGSSLKLCRLAEGAADIYPRLAPTMEWDTAAGHAIALGANCRVVDFQSREDVKYNKENLLNPWFIAYRADAEKYI